MFSEICKPRRIKLKPHPNIRWGICCGETARRRLRGAVSVPCRGGALNPAQQMQVGPLSPDLSLPTSEIRRSGSGGLRTAGEGRGPVSKRCGFKETRHEQGRRGIPSAYMIPHSRRIINRKILLRRASAPTAYSSSSSSGCWSRKTSYTRSSSSSSSTPTSSSVSSS